jgi:hypothetical protein
LKMMITDVKSVSYHIFDAQQTLIEGTYRHLEKAKAEAKTLNGKIMKVTKRTQETMEMEWT